VQHATPVRQKTSKLSPSNLSTIICPAGILLVIKGHLANAEKWLLLWCVCFVCGKRGSVMK